MADRKGPDFTRSEPKSGRGAARWLGIAAAVLLVILVVAWMAGGFGEVEEPMPAEEPALEEPAN